MSIKDLFHYDRIREFYQEYYKDVFLPNEVNGEEMGIINGDELTFFYPMKKNKINYLLPSKLIDELPVVVNDTTKTSFRSKAYHRITDVDSVKIKSERKMSYHDFIINWMDYEHEQPDLFIIWKIITDTAYSDRINIRAMSFPGWLKDSPLSILGQLRGDCIAINKPSYAKLKREITVGNKILGLNEIQELESKDYRALAKYYEDTGDFKPIFINDTISKGETGDRVDLYNHSSMTFYNFPKSDKEQIFEDVFDPKIMSRIFPLLLTGGSHDVTACKHKWGLVTDKLDEDDMNKILNFLRTHKFYEDHDNVAVELIGKDWPLNHTFKNTRWHRNYEAICKRIRLFARSQVEYNKYEEILYQAHVQYMDYVHNRVILTPPIQEELMG